MPHQLPVDTQAAIEHLLRVAVKDKIIIAGFAIGEEVPYTLMNFGTDGKSAGDIKFYELACAAVRERVKRGNVIRQHPSEVV